VRVRALGGFGDASDGPAMSGVLTQLNQDMAMALAARASSFLLLTGADTDATLANYQNMIGYLSGAGFQAVYSGTLAFSTGNPDAPGWLETAQSIEDGLSSTLGLIQRTDLSSLVANFAHNIPTPTGGPNLIPWWWWAIGGVAVLGWAASQGRGLVHETNVARGVSGFSGRGRRRRMRR